MTMLAIVADDLTGAADTSACFADAGWRTVIPFTAVAPGDVDVLALSTESRDMAAFEAAEAVNRAILRMAANSPPRWVYKKVDSAMRGHPRDELLAAMNAVGTRRALVAPALPAEGRTTRGGRQYINGLPLQASSLGSPHGASSLLDLFANDHDLPVIHLPLGLVRQHPAAVSEWLSGEEDGILVADAETDADLDTLARAAAASSLRVLCGAAGFARRLAVALPPGPRRPPLPGAERPILVVAGSQHASTRRQLEVLAEAGAAIVQLPQAAIDDPASSLTDAITAVASHLAAGRTTAVTTVGLTPSASGERTVAARLAEAATAPGVRERAGGLV
ncbi:MAG: four-carbon acid sugar kinase family protein, partial [Thermomicrobiales bacterium]